MLAQNPDTASTHFVAEVSSRLDVRGDHLRSDDATGRLAEAVRIDLDRQQLSRQRAQASDELCVRDRVVNERHSERVMRAYWSRSQETACPGEAGAKTMIRIHRDCIPFPAIPCQPQWER